jgi:hypothetical protein
MVRRDGGDEIYRFVVNGKDFTLASARDSTGKDASRAPDLVITAPAHMIIAARGGETTLSDALASGTASITGSKWALRNFQRIFRLL